MGDDENECPPPPLHCLGEWLEATDLSSRRPAWGSAMGNPGNMVDASLAAPLEGYFEGCGARHEAMPSTAPSASNDGFWDDMPEPLSLEKGARPPVAYDSMLLAHDVQGQRQPAMPRERQRIGPRIGPPQPNWESAQGGSQPQIASGNIGGATACGGQEIPWPSTTGRATHEEDAE